MSRKSGAPPRDITVPMLKWEDTMSPLAGTYSDCRLVLMRLLRTVEEFPWLEPRLRPAIEELRDIRDGIEQTMKNAYAYWNGSFWTRLHELGFEDPEP